ncbi:hypothetical protein EJF36_06780 [Bacillus sp. HMF5848]|uniref:hypothetical protein n=1 Tax=Bacillus sp. HMF5848 TaxID=2495421 RepID=UPI000F795F10|nr:hypothetical protein [Bacillus sp. HMF5848]RSK26586.1 hypothetical protein EJF36_06780 [Bacillus sp. HMF5848]
MKNKIIKTILSILLLSVSPILVLAGFGTLYILFQMIRGFSFPDGLDSFINFINSLVPYFSYLTSIPIIMVLFMILIKYKNKLFVGFTTIS